VSGWWLDFSGYLLTAFVGVVSVVLTIITLPGLWLMLLTVLVYAWLTDWAYLGWPGLLSLLVLATLAEVAEFVAGAAGGKAAGGGWRSMVGAVVGGLVGGIVGQIFIPVPLVGAIIGAIVGSAVGAAGLEVFVERDPAKLADIGWGAGKGRAWGILIKGLVGVVMLLVFLIVGWPSGASVAP
jgi:uncharacterized protein YqgC (DUF456 family)